MPWPSQTSPGKMPCQCSRFCRLAGANFSFAGFLFAVLVEMTKMRGVVWGWQVFLPIANGVARRRRHCSGLRAGLIQPAPRFPVVSRVAGNLGGQWAFSSRRLNQPRSMAAGCRQQLRPHPCPPGTQRQTSGADRKRARSILFPFPGGNPCERNFCLQ